MKNFNYKSSLLAVLVVSSASQVTPGDKSGYFLENLSPDSVTYQLINTRDRWGNKGKEERVLKKATIEPGEYQFFRSHYKQQQPYPRTAKAMILRSDNINPNDYELPDLGVSKSISIKINENRVIEEHDWTQQHSDSIKIINKTNHAVAGTVYLESPGCDWCCSDEKIFIPAQEEKVVNTRNTTCFFTRINLASFKGPGWTNPVFYDLKKKIKSDAIVIITDPENSTHGKITVAAEQVAR